MTTATQTEHSGPSYEIPAEPPVDRAQVLAVLDELAQRAGPGSLAAPAIADVRAGRVTVFDSSDDFVASLDF